MLNHIFLYFSAGKEESVATVTVKDSKDVFALLKGHERKVAPGEEPTFTWFKSGQEFDPQDRFKVLFKDEEDTLALVFQHINPEDAGLYTCVASTSAGKVSCSAELSVEGGVQQLLKVISFFQEFFCHSLPYVENATGFKPNSLLSWLRHIGVNLCFVILSIDGAANVFKIFCIMVFI